MSTRVKPRMQWAHSIAWAVLGPVARRAARAYIAGNTLADALAVRARCADGMKATIGYFNRMEDKPRYIADQNLACLRAVAGTQDYVSVKLSTLHYSRSLLDELVQVAAESQVRLHFDSLQPETAEPTLATLRELLAGGVGCALGYTLPARWQRSVEDACWLRQHRVSIRVVKGEWADPQAPNLDARTGFLRVIDALSAGAHHVAVASHDVTVATESLRRLLTKGVSCEWELLYGLPTRSSIATARRLGVPVRIYIPYGQEMLRYAVNKVVRDPHILLFLTKDYLHSYFPQTP